MPGCSSSIVQEQDAVCVPAAGFVLKREGDQGFPWWDALCRRGRALSESGGMMRREPQLSQEVPWPVSWPVPVLLLLT